MGCDEAALPAEIKIPSRFAVSDKLREWFVSGVSDAIDGFPMPEKEGFSHSHGVGAWDAYSAGYEAGQSWKTRDQEWPV
ncbi:MAG: hypothetical protein ACUVWR_13965 [Anaerolineae bacterium]